METSKVLVSIGVVLIFGVTRAIATCKPQDELGFHIHFVGSNGSEFCEFAELRNFRKVQEILKIRHTYVNLGAKWIFMINGFQENLGSESVQTIIEAYKKRGNFVIFVLEWSMFNHEPYQVTAINKARILAPQIGGFLNELQNQNIINLRTFEFVGISIGAHFAGFISREIYDKSGHLLKIPRITGIDPSGRVYFDSDSLRVLEDHLNSSDAKFVQVIHTDTIYWGTSERLGHADFYPNGGSDQPFCEEFEWGNFLSKKNHCPHFFAIKLFAESISITAERTFMALECDAYSSLAWKICDKATPNRTNYMGYNAIPSIHGNFFLNTNWYPPYSKGKDGMEGLYEE